ncbi:uncharacterized protein Dwil_GK25024 [Drosophila willistoni]|uniref:Uncharacterized protein n=1 Tax=Drosophila willistoni TaxID=7260 RepID=B4NCT6_DROWI|nr:uncharacterized protein LOC6649266 [Drosophila willistoni]EDW82645.1 uncharacterized protein Dwil_GK25024 [Drosophila willistoni]
MSDFGPEVNAIWPIDTNAELIQKLSVFGKKLLTQCQKVEKPKAGLDNVSKFIQKSRKFPLPFGVNTCRIMSQPMERRPEMEKQISSVYPVIHERTLLLYLNYLEHKTLWCNEVERPVYESLSLCAFIQRLLEKRCASFFARQDTFLLLSGHKGAGGFESIGTTKEKSPLKLEQCLSYDDIKMAALLSVSSHTEFINEGERTNCGRVQRDRRKLEPEGVIMGLIGARLSRPHLMEFQDIIISRSQNTQLAGYGCRGPEPKTQAESYRQIWRKFYETEDFKYGQVYADNQRFGHVSNNERDVFDNMVMKRRYAITFDMLLLEAQARAMAADKLAYIHVVGFGLGVWKVAKQQEQIFLETFEQRLRQLGECLTHIGVVHFSWFTITHCGGLYHNARIPIAKHPHKGISIQMSKRDPAQKFAQTEHQNMLLVVSYAWDGNALPGNEFWMNKLKSTGDSSTACSTLITELHNPHINTEYCNGNNLHIASPKLGIIHIAEYAKTVLPGN